MTSAEYLGIFAMTCVAVNLGFGYFFLRNENFGRVLVISSAGTVFLYQLFVYFDLGYLDPFFLIAVAIQIPFSFAIGAAVLRIVLLIRQRSRL